ncbi:MAG: 30S ribosomal protein S8 [Armatimonadota bacterium]
MHSDPIADLLTRIRNGCHARLATVDVPFSNLKLEIVRILKAEGFISDFEITSDGKFRLIRVRLRYDSKRRPILREIRRVSKPGLRVYKGAGELTPRRSGLATQILTTNKGVMTDRDARKQCVGGEVICEVW